MGDAIITAVATLLAVVIGGWLTYQRTSRLEDRRAERQNQADKVRFDREEERLVRQHALEEKDLRRQNLYALREATNGTMVAIIEYLAEFTETEEFESREHLAAKLRVSTANLEMTFLVQRISDFPLTEAKQHFTAITNQTIAAKGPQFQREWNQLTKAVATLNRRVQVLLHAD